MKHHDKDDNSGVDCNDEILTIMILSATFLMMTMNYDDYYDDDYNDYEEYDDGTGNREEYSDKRQRYDHGHGNDRDEHLWKDKSFNYWSRRQTKKLSTGERDMNNSN